MKKQFEHPALDYIREYPEDHPEYDLTKLVVDVKFEVCPECHGNGTHFRRDLDENLLVQEMLEDGDEDGVEAYRGGRFDQQCDTCHGKRVVEEPDWDQLPKWAVDEITGWEEGERDFAIVNAQERACGA